MSDARFRVLSIYLFYRIVGSSPSDPPMAEHASGFEGFTSDMSVDVVDLTSFYASPLGLAVQRLVSRKIDELWPSLQGLSLLGLGYAIPYFETVRDGAERILAFMPASQGVVNWPTSGLSSTALVDPLAMPLPEASIDRVLIAHALETVENPAEFLSELWRILTPGGRIILIAPNRRGIWARLDTTPFGDGQPFSRSQLKELMRKALLSPEHWAETLYMPPFQSRLLLRTAMLWERIGSSFVLPFSGLHVIEASKQLYRPILARAPQRAHRRSSVLLPAPAPSPTSRSRRSS